MYRRVRVSWPCVCSEKFCLINYRACCHYLLTSHVTPLWSPFSGRRQKTIRSTRGTNLWRGQRPQTPAPITMLLKDCLNGIFVSMCIGVCGWWLCVCWFSPSKPLPPTLRKSSAPPPRPVPPKVAPSTRPIPPKKPVPLVANKGPRAKVGVL